MKFACYLIALTVFIPVTNSLPAQDAVAELHAAIKPVPRGDDPDSWWMKRHQAMNDRVADGNVDLIVFKAKRGTGITGKIPLKVDRGKMTVMDREDAGVVDTSQTVSRPSIFGTGRN